FHCRDAFRPRRAAAASSCVRGQVAAAGVAAAEASSLWAYDLRAPRVTLVSYRRRFRVRAAFFAAAERDRADRCLATRFACLDKACFDADRRVSRLIARLFARERLAVGFLRRPWGLFVRSSLDLR